MTEKTDVPILDEVIQDGLQEIVRAGDEAVEKTFEEDARGGMDHFTGLAGIPREVLESEDYHIVRGVD